MDEFEDVAVDLLRDRLRAGTPVDIRAKGYSMWPSLRDGAVVRVEPCVGPLRPGDVVLFERDGRLVLHRVLRVTRTRLLLKGDARRDPDGWVLREDVFGRLARRPVDGVMARLAPRLATPLSLASAIVRRSHGFASKF